jgi:putative tributyrin esterase
MKHKFLHHFNGRRTGRQSACRASTLFLTIILFTSNPCTAQSGPKSSPRSAKQHSEVTLKSVSFHSASLDREMHYVVLLPVGYNTSEQRYPVLFLLHGLYGDDQNWSTRTNLAKYAKNLHLIIAMPDAGNSWYVNSATNPAEKYEDYIIKDFLEEIDTRYRTIREGYARAIAGLSMGGYAAVKFSLKYPHLFAYAGGISAALDAPADLDETHPEFRDNLRKAFGEPGNPVRSENDVYVLLLHAEIKALPYFYLDCGSDDSFLDANRKFVFSLRQRKAPYEFHELQGGHTWEYWDAAIDRFLIRLARSNFAHGAMLAGAAWTKEHRPFRAS